VARVIYSHNAIRNLERVLAYTAEAAPGNEMAAARAIRSAVNALAEHPHLGRPVRHGLRQLLISYGKTGYIALYRFVAARDVVRVLAIRHQRELDYAE
jgi:plasmid stabilization system protein ParE